MRSRRAGRVREPLLAPERRVRVAVVVGDRLVAGALVDAARARLLRARVEPCDGVAQVARERLERGEQLAPDAAAARLGNDVHALGLARAVVESLDATAGHRAAV